VYIHTHETLVGALPQTRRFWTKCPEVFTFLFRFFFYGRGKLFLFAASIVQQLDNLLLHLLRGFVLAKIFIEFLTGYNHLTV
jgi:hypothetical protein